MQRKNIKNREYYQRLIDKWENKIKSYDYEKPHLVAYMVDTYHRRVEDDEISLIGRYNVLNAIKHAKDYCNECPVEPTDATRMTTKDYAQIAEWWTSEKHKARMVNSTARGLFNAILYTIRDQDDLNADMGKLNRAKNLKMPTKQDAVKLTLNIVDVMELYEFPDSKLSETLQRVRDAFVFSCFTGLRMMDVYFLDKRQAAIKEVEVDEMTTMSVLCTYTRKGKRYLEIPLIKPEIIKAILKKYDWDLYFARWTKSHQYIKEILEIMDKEGCEVPKKRHVDVRRSGKETFVQHRRYKQAIRFHTGRHTFTKFLLESDIDVFSASKILGHRSPQTTMNYYAQMGVDKRNMLAFKKLTGLGKI